MPKPDLAALSKGFSKGPKGHSQWAGVDLTDCGDDWAEIRLPVAQSQWMRSGKQRFIAGPLITLVDSACATAVLMKIQEYRPVTTVDMRVDMVRPVATERQLIARSECYSFTGHLALVKTVVHDGNPDDPIATAMTSFYVQ